MASIRQPCLAKNPFNEAKLAGERDDRAIREVSPCASLQRRKLDRAASARLARSLGAPKYG
jgi:hypothetical protein